MASQGKDKAPNRKERDSEEKLGFAAHALPPNPPQASASSLDSRTHPKSMLNSTQINRTLDGQVGAAKEGKGQGAKGRREKKKERRRTRNMDALPRALFVILPFNDTPEPKDPLEITPFAPTLTRSQRKASKPCKDVVRRVETKGDVSFSRNGHGTSTFSMAMPRKRVEERVGGSKGCVKRRKKSTSAEKSIRFNLDGEMCFSSTVDSRYMKSCKKKEPKGIKRPKGKLTNSCVPKSMATKGAKNRKSKSQKGPRPKPKPKPKPTKHLIPTILSASRSPQAPPSGPEPLSAQTPRPAPRAHSRNSAPAAQTSGSWCVPRKPPSRFGPGRHIYPLVWKPPGRRGEKKEIEENERKVSKEGEEGGVKKDRMKAKKTGCKSKGKHVRKRAKRRSPADIPHPKRTTRRNHVEDATIKPPPPSIQKSALAPFLTKDHSEPSSSTPEALNSVAEATLTATLSSDTVHLKIRKNPEHRLSNPPPNRVETWKELQKLDDVYPGKHDDTEKLSHVGNHRHAEERENKGEPSEQDPKRFGGESADTWPIVSEWTIKCNEWSYRDFIRLLANGIETKKLTTPAIKSKTSAAAPPGYSQTSVVPPTISSVPVPEVSSSKNSISSASKPRVFPVSARNQSSVLPSDSNPTSASILTSNSGGSTIPKRVQDCEASVGSKIPLNLKADVTSNHVQIPATGSNEAKLKDGYQNHPDGQYLPSGANIVAEAQSDIEPTLALQESVTTTFGQFFGENPEDVGAAGLNSRENSEQTVQGEESGVANEQHQEDSDRTSTLRSTSNYKKRKSSNEKQSPHRNHLSTTPSDLPRPSKTPPSSTQPNTHTEEPFVSKTCTPSSSLTNPFERSCQRSSLADVSPAEAVADTKVVSSKKAAGSASAMPDKSQGLKAVWSKLAVSVSSSSRLEEEQMRENQDGQSKTLQGGAPEVAKAGDSVKSRELESTDISGGTPKYSKEAKKNKSEGFNEGCVLSATSDANIGGVSMKEADGKANLSAVAAKHQATSDESCKSRENKKPVLPTSPGRCYGLLGEVHNAIAKIVCRHLGDYRSRTIEPTSNPPKSPSDPSSPIPPQSRTSAESSRPSLSSTYLDLNSHPKKNHLKPSDKLAKRKGVEKGEQGSGTTEGKPRRGRGRPRKHEGKSEVDDLIASSSGVIGPNRKLGAFRRLKRWVNPGDLPEMPKVPGNVRQTLYTVDNEQRLLIGDFSKEDMMETDMSFLRSCMEIDHITVIIRGLARNFSSTLWNPNYILRKLSPMVYHKFRRFVKHNPTRHSSSGQRFFEEREWLSMPIEDYRKYLSAHASGEDISKILGDILPNGRRKSSLSEEDVIYLIDLPLYSCLPELFEDLRKSLPMNLLPGGENCFLRFLPPNGRPNMGPNIYITPPGAYTWFHQDGHGTVDSGHLCLQGRNQVIMLRNLSTTNKETVINLLRGGRPYDLSSLPHDSPRSKHGRVPLWPSEAMIRRLRDMGAAPSVFVLEPGDYLHINKGRLHAFRKLPYKDEKLCMSVAWDWLFPGVSSQGIASEIKKATRNALENRSTRRSSLGIIQTCALRAAETLTAILQDKRLKGMSNGELLRKREFLRGLEPVLVEMYQMHLRMGQEDATTVVDTWVPPHERTIDPYGVEGFECRICRAELYNIYMHCRGCETLLGKDWNICPSCYSSGAHIVNEAKSTHHGHRAEVNGNPSKCSCRVIECQECDQCIRCSCTCHISFQRRYRFFSMKGIYSLVCQIRELLNLPKLPPLDSRRRNRRGRGPSIR